ncbi:hypothetical protein HWV62_23609 [Athelia sp. TMB]|nr:hypothetical protein HWV62_23609 [Athelia sp. TMB]
MNIQSLLNADKAQHVPRSMPAMVSSSLPPTATAPSPSPPTTTPPSPLPPAPEPIILAPHLRGHRSPVPIPSHSPPLHIPTLSTSLPNRSPPLKRPLSPDRRHDDAPPRSPPQRRASHSPTTHRPSHSPPVPRHSPLGGLEALVQAATQEQRRIEATERASHSPVDVRAPLDLRPARSPTHSANTRSLVPLDVTPHPAKRPRRSHSPRRSSSGEQDAHEWLLEHYAGPPDTPAPDADADATDADDLDMDMGMEVDDELLSLVEPAPPPPPPQQRFPFAAPPPALRLSKPLMPTVITTIHSPPVPTPSPLGPGGMAPPPAASAKPAAKSKKKAAPAANSVPKPKPAAKSRAKPKPKPEPTQSLALKKTSAAAAATAARSRSASQVPADAPPEPVADATAKEDEVDDKLYCICATRYDEERVMIACDRCDEWYHTACVGVSDAEVDLIDQFICPPCAAAAPPAAPLRTTYKARCHRADCGRPARGELSKYCSDACGVAEMDARIGRWAAAGGARAALWDAVKGAERRTGVTRLPGGAQAPKAANGGALNGGARLEAQLAGVVREHERLKREMDVVLWRARLVELAAQRAERVPGCAWDQRLCFGDEEYAEYGAGVLASYEGAAGDAAEGEWWCRGKKKCARHAGWQKLRAAEVAFEKEMKEAGLARLTTRERELRKRLEDLAEPARALPPLQPTNRPAANGHAKKGKKKRAY